MISIPMDPVFVWLMVFLRTTFLFTFFPLFGDGFVPLKIRIVLAFSISFALSPVVPLTGDMLPTTNGGILVWVASEALLGFSIGMIGKCMFAVVQYAGQIAGEQMGFGIMNAIDPTSSRQISVIAEMEYVLSLMIFLAIGMHHLVIVALAASFSILPPGTISMNGEVNAFFIDLGAMIFELSVQFAMPIIVVVFVVNLVMGMVGRAVPQINIFIESFPLRIVAGLVVTILSLSLIVHLWINMFSNMEPMIASLFRALGG